MTALPELLRTGQVAGIASGESQSTQLLPPQLGSASLVESGKHGLVLKGGEPRYAMKCLFSYVPEERQISLSKTDVSVRTRTSIAA